MPNNDTTSITIVDDVSITVPESLQLMTTFILHEQNDWFEDEIKFIRHFIKPGMKVVDIGANYGLYTLSIAKIIGTSGMIWAFEPTEATSACLKKSISDNAFGNVRLVQSGLSNRMGKAKLFTSENSELNSLSKEAASSSRHETISLLTLDHCKQKYAWDSIDFLKLDAEGEECNILKMGKKALAHLSPLIMFELKHVKNINLPLINKFKRMGYDSYRLIPKLNVLVPFNHTEPFDSFLLNLFCCKDDNAILLRDAGIIVDDWPQVPKNTGSSAMEYISTLGFWSDVEHQVVAEDSHDSAKYLEILNAYALSVSDLESGATRVGCLMSALSGLRNMIARGEHRFGRLITFSRIAFDAGERKLGLSILSGLMKKYSTNLDFEVDGLFLPATESYDSISPGSSVKEWLFSSLIEQCIVKHAFSTYFTRKASLPMFEQLSSLGFITKDMSRRYALVKECFS